MRPPCGLTTDLFNYANDIDIYREWANVVVHNRFEARWTRPYHACYVGRKDRKNYRHSPSAIRARLGHRLVHQERIQSIFAGAIGDHGFILRSPHLDGVISRTTKDGLVVRRLEGKNLGAKGFAELRDDPLAIDQYAWQMSEAAWGN